MTISVWLYLKSGGDTYKRIVDKSDGGAGTHGYTLWVDTRKLGFNVGGTYGWDVDDITAIDYDTWHHVVIVNDQIETRAYIDGIEEPGAIYAGSHLTPSNDLANMRIGSWNHSTGREFMGTLDEVRIYNRALSASEIYKLYKLGTVQILQ